METSDGIFECRARGIFRKNGITPLSGDRVEISLQEDGTGSVDEILPRKNSLVRPPVANIDYLFVICSVCEPAPNTLLIDRILAVAEDKEIEPVVVITKADREDAEPLAALYRQTGIKTLVTSAGSEEGKEELRSLLKGRVSAFTGNSGVGKSTLLNGLYESFALPTGEISKKLGRGRHTTRHVELLKLPEGGYVADTPGFSAIDFEKYAFIRKENLQFCFREFADYRDKCRFSTSCSHTKEKGCAVLKAVEEGKISAERHKNYVMMYEEVRSVEDWQIKD